MNVGHVPALVLRDGSIEELPSTGPLIGFFENPGTVREAKMEHQPGITKKYLTSRPVCKVTFRLPCDGALAAETVTVVGEFNNWDERATPMRRQKNGDFMVTVELEKDKEYRFRYCIDGEKWENDWCADRYDPNPFGGHDSVVVV